MQEVQARGGKVIAVTDRDGEKLCDSADFLLVIPGIIDDLMPILTSVPLQLLAYHIAVLKGTDVDQPRNLGKGLAKQFSFLNRYLTLLLPSKERLKGKNISSRS